MALTNMALATEPSRASFRDEDVVEEAATVPFLAAWSPPMAQQPRYESITDLLDGALGTMPPRTATPPPAPAVADDAFAGIRLAVLGPELLALVGAADCGSLMRVSTRAWSSPSYARWLAGILKADPAQFNLSIARAEKRFDGPASLAIIEHRIRARAPLALAQARAAVKEAEMLYFAGIDLFALARRWARGLLAADLGAARGNAAIAHIFGAALESPPDALGLAAPAAATAARSALRAALIRELAAGTLVVEACALAPGTPRIRRIEAALWSGGFYRVTRNAVLTGGSPPYQRWRDPMLCAAAGARDRSVQSHAQKAKIRAAATRFLERQAAGGPPWRARTKARWLDIVRRELLPGFTAPLGETLAENLFNEAWAATATPPEWGQIGRPRNTPES